MKHLFCTLAALALPAAPPRPRLVVVVSVDQGSAELMDRWGQHGPGGLGSLLRRGTTFTATYHAQGITETAPGHSTILTGAYPCRTGIPQNEWWDPATGKLITSVQDPGCVTHGAPAPGSSPRNLLASTLGEWLLAQVPGSRSFAVTGKDRSAILMAGHQASGVYWFQAAVGFTTSTAYAPRLPDWVQAHNTALNGRFREGGLRWEPLRDGDLRTWSGPFQLEGRSMISSLPRPILEVGGLQDDAFWTRFKASPAFDEAILDMAEALCREERLGRGKATDLLAVGLSATDYVGHLYGTAGVEMQDQFRRLDARLARFLAVIRKADPHAWVILTADHGACDVPERLALQHYRARRLPAAAWKADVQKRLREALHLDQDLLNLAALPQVSLVERVAATVRQPREALLAAAEAVLEAAPGVAEVFSGREMASLAPSEAMDPTRLSFPERMRLSWCPGRSGDLQIVWEPYTLLDDPCCVASHGSPYDYDRRVWLAFTGPWAPERRREPVRVVDLAPTLAAALGLRLPDSVSGRPLSLRQRR